MQTDPLFLATCASSLCIKTHFPFAKSSENSDGQILIPEGNEDWFGPECSHKKSPHGHPDPPELGELSSGWEIHLCVSGGRMEPVVGRAPQPRAPSCPLVVVLLLLAAPPEPSRPLHHLTIPALCPTRCNQRRLMGFLLSPRCFFVLFSAGSSVPSCPNISS